MPHFDSLKLFTSGRLIFLRWFLLFGGILSISLWSRTNLLNSSGDFSISPEALVLFILFGAIVLNGIYLIFYRFIYSKTSAWGLFFLNITQVISDFLVVVIIILIFGDLSQLLPLLIFLPILESIILLSPIWSLILVALSISVLSILSLFGGTNFLISDFKFLISDLPTVGNLSDLYTVVLYGIIYLVFTIFVSISSNLLVAQTKDMLEKKAEEDELEEDLEDRERTLWSRKLLSKVDSNNRALRAKDLELSLAKKQLAQLEHAKSEFISVTTHQLRTPMSAIKWTFNMMISEQLGPVNEEQKEFLAKGYESTLRTMAIINNLVHIDHDVASKSDYNFVPINLTDFIKKILGEFSNQAESKEITLNLTASNANLPSVNVDTNKMQMVFENLIDNAMKYTPRKGKVSVFIKDDKLNSAQPAIEVVVIDSGVGIPADEQKKIFHKFYRASNARRQEPDGSGIGLFIARDIVENHNGALWFESTENEGTTFHVVIPINQKIENSV